jgi:hypothetical protein
VIGRRVLLAFALAAAALAIGSVTKPGQVAAADPPARLQFEAESRDDGSWMLRAKLTRGGTVQSQQTVQFLQRVDFFGDRWVPLGTSISDAAGVASWLYSPTTNGAQELIARLTANDGTFESDRVGITVRDAVPAIPDEPLVLPIVRAWAFPVGAAVLFLVWLALAVIFLRAVLGIARPTIPQSIRRGPSTAGPAASSPHQPSSTE